MKRPPWLKPDGTLTNDDPLVKAIHKVFIDWASAVARDQHKKSSNALRINPDDMDDLFVQVIQKVTTATVGKLVDPPASGAGARRGRTGSTPVSRTKG